MEAPTRVRSSVPWGLLGMLLAVAAVERYVVQTDLDLVGNIAADWSRAGAVLPRAAPGSQVLYLGDSMMKFGLLPRVVHEDSRMRGYNFALQSGSSPSSYFLLRRALKAGAKPRAVVVDCAWGCLEDGPASVKRPYPWAELLDLRESAELAWTARDAGLFAKIMAGRNLASYRRREDIRVSIRKAVRGEISEQREITRFLLRNWTKNGGAQANWKNLTFADGASPPAAPRTRPVWHCDPTNARFMNKLIDVAARRGIPVYWLLVPPSPRTQLCLEREGDDAAYEAFIRATMRAHPNLVVVDGRHAGYDAHVFVDEVHLDRDGAVALSHGVAEVLRRGPQAGAAGGRWVALPRFSDRKTDAFIEDVGESRQALKLDGSSVAR